MLKDDLLRVGLRECQLCGAMYVNKALHDRWHEAILAAEPKIDAHLEHLRREQGPARRDIIGY